MAPVYFPVLPFKDLRLGAPEEGALRPPADNKVDAQTLQQWVAEAAKTSDEPGILTQLRETVTKPATTITSEQQLSKTDSSISVNLFNLFFCCVLLSLIVQLENEPNFKIECIPNLLCTFRNPTPRIQFWPRCLLGCVPEKMSGPPRS